MRCGLIGCFGYCWLDELTINASAFVWRISDDAGGGHG